MLRRTDCLDRHHLAALIVLLVAATAAHLLVVPHARAATPAFTGVGRLAVPLLSRATASAPTAPRLQEQQSPEPPPFADPASGPVVSILGGSVFSGASAFQTGAAFAYFFGPKATFGFEAEGNLTFGPAGRVAQGMGSFIVQVGARTSKFVPYFAIGGGYVYAKSKFPDATQEVLDRFGIDPEPKTEQAPFLQFGGGVRFYIKPKVAFRADVRFAQVALNVEGDLSFSDRLFPMRRISGMVSWDF
jgi:hypothetical protein